MTPEEARRLLDNFDRLLPFEAELEVEGAAKDMAAMIAGMHTEYRAEEWRGLVIGWVPTSPWTAEKPAGGTDPHTRIVRRYVTTPEEA